MSKIPAGLRTLDGQTIHARRIVMLTITMMVFLLTVSMWSPLTHAADPGDIEAFMDSGSCPGCDLSGALLDRADADGGDLSDANLHKTSLYRASLSSANLNGADLSSANLTFSFLDGADLRYASLEGANLAGATLSGSDTTGVLTDVFTTCPDGTAGPCDFLEVN